MVLTTPLLWTSTTIIYLFEIAQVHNAAPVVLQPNEEQSAIAAAANNATTVFDQKQNGDYNIQLHLKDFNIIALFADDEAFGDYDYSYDENDFTIKPPANATTSRPNITTAAIITSTSSTAAAQTSPKPSNNNAELEKQPETPPALPLQPDRIKVQIIQSETTAANSTAASSTSSSSGRTNVEQPSADHHGHRKCAQGFTRDRRGRCRKMVKHSSLGLGRLASTLVTRLRQTLPPSNKQH